VSEAVPTPDGPYLFVDAPAVASKRLGEILDIVARRLEAEGVTDALLALAGQEEGPLMWLGHTQRAAVLRLYPPPPIVQRFQRDRSDLPPHGSTGLGLGRPGLGEEESVLARMDVM
jgi:hypothetical protein